MLLKLFFIISFHILFVRTSFPQTIVSDFRELINAISAATEGDEILLEDGVYNIESGFSAIGIGVNNITIRSKSGVRENVVINGRGMFADEHHGFWVGADDVTICDLTIQNVRYHCIQTATKTDRLHVKNCVLRDAGEQLFKVPADFSDPCENGVIENCLFEYTSGIGPQWYIGGIDCHFAKNWIVISNVFKYIRSPDANLAEHAIHFWNGSEGTIVEKNLIINCDRGIGFGLGDSKHEGGIIRNNMIYHSKYTTHDLGDVGIGLESSTNSIVANNTIYFENDYPNAIEYRFVSTNNVYISNNLTNRAIASRNGGSGELVTNVSSAFSSWFVNVKEGDLHLISENISSVINKGTNIPEVFEDFDGDTRPQNNKFDIGADEYIIPTSVASNQVEQNFQLYQNYPNPFNPVTTIKYNLPENVMTHRSGLQQVTLKIYNLLGKEIVTLVNKHQSAGSYQAKWDASDQISGVYMYKLKVGNYSESKKLILIK